ncbi:MAG: hypothetical protein IT529_02660 [Burkholderiales bacterium]|nr:hypothetical protein [Burkholderiales bacterium]
MFDRPMGGGVASRRGRAPASGATLFAGPGFRSHLAAVDLHHIPYKGGASLMAVAAGEPHISIVPIPSAISHPPAGRLFPIATGGEKRSTIVPEVPTAIEAGVPR